jgi:H+/Cl- antiporter ClcA
MTASPPADAAAPPVDPAALLRSPEYLRLLAVAAVLGVPVSAGAYFFLQLVGHLQTWVFRDLPEGLGLGTDPWWWPLLPLTLAGLPGGHAVRSRPAGGGESPADGLPVGLGPPAAAAVPGIFLASVLTLSLGAVLGPEAPLIALGAGVSAWAMRLLKRDAPAQAVAVIGGAGSFAAVSALLGSPLLGAFLLLEAAGLAGALGSVILLPGLLAAGIGALVFVGLDSLTGLGAVTLSLPGLPGFAHPDVAQFGWAIVIGVAAALLAAAIRRLALAVRPHVTAHLVLGSALAGLVVALAAVAYQASTDGSAREVLFSGQSALPQLVSQSADYSVATLLVLVLCKSVAYGVSMSAFRGGPVFPAMFVGAAGGMLLSHAPGLPLVPAVAMGIGAMSVSMLKLPITSVMLATLLLFSDGLAVMPLVIVSVVVAFVTTAHLGRRPG